MKCSVLCRDSLLCGWSNMVGMVMWCSASGSWWIKGSLLCHCQAAWEVVCQISRGGFWHCRIPLAFMTAICTLETSSKHCAFLCMKAMLFQRDMYVCVFAVHWRCSGFSYGT